MKDMMQYKNYWGSVHYSDEDQIFYGKIEFIRDLISYEGDNVHSLKKAFEDAVNDYLELCAKEGKEPEQPFKGSFNVRVGSELHQRLAAFAKEHHLNLNQVIVGALNQYLTV